MKRMLINATQQEEVRVALVDGQKLYDLDIESPEHANKKANIYKGTITRIEPSLEAAFVDYGMDRHGFLPIKEIAREYYPEGTSFSDHNALKSLLHEGQEVIVQIEKEERGQKGAALTTYISLAGSYLVLMPNNPRAGGISRRIEGDERTELKHALEGINIPQGMGVIVRTAGVGKSSEELAWDLSILTKLWEMIKNAAASKPAPFLIYQESNIAMRAVRDYLRPDIGEILIDDRHVFEQIKNQIDLVRPEFAQRVHLYNGDIPLFSKFQIESQIESAYQREVRLPSGGAIVIDPTEALTSIDVNSAKATKGGDIEETALQTNIEAAEEIARQLRLRDIGGLIVIDFIDMTPVKNQREIESRMREAVRQDRARIQFSRISRFGLLEMSRQRLRPSLEESSAHVCPMCQGQGTVRDTSSLALSVLRLVEEEAHKNTGDVFAIAPVEVATFILNEKRSKLAEIEKRHKIRVSVIPDQHMMPPQFEVQRLLGQNAPGFYDSSTTVINQRTQEHRRHMQETIMAAQVEKNDSVRSQAVAEPVIDQGFINDITIKAPRHPAPQEKEVPKEPSFLGKIIKGIAAIFKSDEPAVPEPAADAKKPAAGRSGSSSSSATGSSRRSGGNRSRNAAGGTGSSSRRPRTERSERTERQERPERPEHSEKSERTGQKKAAAQKQAPRRQPKGSEESSAKQPRQSKGRSRSEGTESRHQRKAAPAAAAVVDQNELTGEAPHSIAKAQAIAFAREREEEAARKAAGMAARPYEPKAVDYIDSPAGEGPLQELEFTLAHKSRPDDQGADFEHSAQTGGFAAARNADGIDGISEPAVYQVSFGAPLSARPLEEGAAFEYSTLSSGFSGARDVYASGIINTEEPVKPQDAAVAAESAEADAEVKTEAAAAVAVPAAEPSPADAPAEAAEVKTEPAAEAPAAEAAEPAEAEPADSKAAPETAEAAVEVKAEAEAEAETAAAEPAESGAAEAEQTAAEEVKEQTAADSDSVSAEDDEAEKAAAPAEAAETAAEAEEAAPAATGAAEEAKKAEAEEAVASADAEEVAPAADEAADQAAEAAGNAEAAQAEATAAGTDHAAQAEAEVVEPAAVPQEQAADNAEAAAEAEAAPAENAEGAAPAPRRPRRSGQSRSRQPRAPRENNGNRENSGNRENNGTRENGGKAAARSSGQKKAPSRAPRSRQGGANAKGGAKTAAKNAAPARKNSAAENAPAAAEE